MQNVMAIDPHAFKSRQGLIKFRKENSTTVWVGITKNPTTRILGIQMALRNQRLPVDLVPRQLCRALKGSELEIEFVPVDEVDLDVALDQLKSELEARGELGERRKNTATEQHGLYKVTHPACPEIVYFGSYAESIGFKRAVLCFKQNCLSYLRSRHMRKKGSLAHFVQGRNLKFCNGFVITPLDGTTTENYLSARALVKNLSHLAMQNGLTPLSK